MMKHSHFIPLCSRLLLSGGVFLALSVQAQQHALSTNSEKHVAPPCICVVDEGNHFNLPLNATTRSSSFSPRATHVVESIGDAPRLSDGIFRNYRLAVYMSYNEFASPKFESNVEKVKAFWHELETYLNNIYVRDLGVHFTIIQDERLIEKRDKGEAYTYRAGTGLINAAIGEDAYDVGLLLDFFDGPGIRGLGQLGGVTSTTMKGWSIVSSQDETTMAHELGHLFGAPHPMWQGAGVRGEGTEPRSGQSIVSYGYPYLNEFLSLESIRKMRKATEAADWKLPKGATHISENTPPRIERSKMRNLYRVPQSTFFTIPVHASDAKQSRLLYAFNQFGCSYNHPATFPVFPPQESNILRFGRRYGEGGTQVANSDVIPVGNYQFWLSVSDALPTSEAIARQQAPLYDGYIANIQVVNATPFKITTNIASSYEIGEAIRLNWSVDKTFFPKGSKVRVVMSDDFGKTFRHVLVPSTENDGECTIFLPQQLMERFATYLNIFFAGKGVLRLETIDDEVQYYDITSQAMNGGGIELKESPVKFQGLPNEHEIFLSDKAPLPAIPTVSATNKGQKVEVQFNETTKDLTTIRTWQVEANGKTYGMQQFITRDAASEQPEEPATPPAKPEEPIAPEKPTVPEKPSVPEKPAEPEQPVSPPAKPEEPIAPEKPTVPEKPAEPEQPVSPPAKPEEPIAPEKPTVPEKPAEPEQPVSPPAKPKPILVEKVIFHTESDTLTLGDELLITAEVLPRNAQHRALKWEISDNSVLRIIGDGLYKTIAVGDVIVTATTTDGSKLSVSRKFHIRQPNALSPASFSAIRTHVAAQTLQIWGLSPQTYVRLLDTQGRVCSQKMARSNALQLRLPQPDVFFLFIDGRFFQKVIATN